MHIDVDLLHSSCTMCTLPMSGSPKRRQRLLVVDVMTISILVGLMADCHEAFGCTLHAQPLLRSTMVEVEDSGQSTWWPSAPLLIPRLIGKKLSTACIGKQLLWQTPPQRLGTTLTGTKRVNSPCGGHQLLYPSNGWALAFGVHNDPCCTMHVMHHQTWHCACHAWFGPPHMHYAL